jgi:alginate O-acetyltransferase complex protein AlgI
MPYLAANISEFWRRWHISLSSWLRDYLFIPLGGSRLGTWKTYRNLLIVMLLGGLWHGANWTFVIWGLYHGLLLALHRAIPWPRFLGNPMFRPVCVAATLLAVCVGWVFFRAATLGQAGTILQHVFVPTGGLRMPLHSNGLWYTLALVVLAHLAGRFGAWRRLQERLPATVLGGAYAVALTAALLFATDTGKAFIYFQF